MTSEASSIVSVGSTRTVASGAHRAPLARHRAVLTRVRRAVINTVRSLCAMTLLAASSVGCAGAGQFVWVDDVSAAESAGPPSADYLIREGDVVAVRVFGQEALSTRARVRPDGRIAMPALGDVDVRGKRPNSIKGELEARLKDYVNTPNVTVTVEESQTISVSVLGEVARPGVFPFEPTATVPRALASAGGLTEFATKDRIFLIRQGSSFPTRIRFTYEALTRGNGKASGFVLRQGDLLVVE